MRQSNMKTRIRLGSSYSILCGEDGDTVKWMLLKMWGNPTSNTFSRCIGETSGLVARQHLRWLMRFICSYETQIIPNTILQLFNLENMKTQEYDIHIYCNKILVPGHCGNVRHLYIRFWPCWAPWHNLKCIFWPPNMWFTRQNVPTCNSWGNSTQFLEAWLISHLLWFSLSSPHHCGFQPVRNSLVKIVLIGADSLATAAWTIWWFCLNRGTLHCHNLPD